MDEEEQNKILEPFLMQTGSQVEEKPKKEKKQAKLKKPLKQAQSTQEAMAQALEDISGAKQNKE